MRQPHLVEQTAARTVVPAVAAMIFEASAALARRSSTNRRNPTLHESRARRITLRPGVTLPCLRRTAAILSRSAITAFVVVYRPSLTGKRARAAFLASRIPPVTSASVAVPMPYPSAWRTMSLWLITFWRSVRCAIAQATASLAGLAAFGSHSTVLLEINSRNLIPCPVALCFQSS